LKFIVGKRTQRVTDVCYLSDFADQSMPFIGPRREGGIAKQAIEFQFRDLVAFAGSLPQSLVVEDRDVPPPIPDKPGFLQGAHHIGDRGSPHAQHHPQEFVGEQKVAGWHPVDMAASVPWIGAYLARFLRGGDEVGGATLTRFFGFHVAVLPGLVTLCLVVHLGLIQKFGISSPPRVEEEHRRKGTPVPQMPFFPNFFLRELMAWYGALGVLGALAALFPWELGEKADPFVSAPAGIRPEWYLEALCIRRQDKGLGEHRQLESEPDDERQHTSRHRRK
jgi:hypothetical protein